uniref:WGS project CBMI000000000 data, contig CS3069_c003478 n=1 Tax=Fusarium clavum TaxID=2594811 RepID=A0A090MDY3_9HYPO|nr:unnamed protein product [Fusarium clavum]
MNTLYMSLQIADSFVAMWTLEASIFSLSDLSQVSIWHLVPTMTTENEDTFSVAKGDVEYELQN